MEESATVKELRNNRYDISTKLKIIAVAIAAIVFIYYTRKFYKAFLITSI